MIAARAEACRQVYPVGVGSVHPDVFRARVLHHLETCLVFDVVCKDGVFSDYLIDVVSIALELHPENVVRRTLLYCGRRLGCSVFSFDMVDYLISMGHASDFISSRRENIFLMLSRGQGYKFLSVPYPGSPTGVPGRDPFSADGASGLGLCWCC